MTEPQKEYIITEKLLTKLVVEDLSPLERCLIGASIRSRSAKESVLEEKRNVKFVKVTRKKFAGDD